MNRSKGLAVALGVSLSISTLGVLVASRARAAGPGLLPQVSIPSGYIDVKSYGATGNGSTDDTHAIQNAVNACPQGGVVYVPPGTYMINAVFPPGGILLHGNMTFQMSPASTLQAITSSATEYSILRVWDVQNVQVIGGILKGERATHTGTTGEWGFGLDIRGADNVSVENVLARDCWGDGFFIDRTLASSTRRPLSTRVRLRGCTGDNNRRQGLSVVGLSGGTIDSCTFKNTAGTSPQSGVDLEPDPGTTGGVVEDVKITHCLFLNNHDMGLIASGGTLCHRNVIEGCTSSGNECGFMTMNSATQISFVNNTATNNWIGIYLLGGDLHRVENNFLFANTGAGIRVRAATNTLVCGNVCAQNSQGGSNTADNIYLSDGATNCTVVGNTCRKGSAAALTRYGIRIDAGCTGNMIASNDCLNGGASGAISDAGASTFLTGNR